ncbi:3-keto-disaccharide hydrolase [Segetibacter aerophilus]|uniref:3-keto-alpha-glucoside-1,2-lyase/3-keto-2-hydroxy-glucal hydratase domain-containing protein n=1 Tax=Segetibacter aerophilus TaxID=670293 RepID=A0A512B753_9BACT|nr:DUF1080 domain-containing protein [Segetibacter aerophilus]GEO07778.1 hypothetical protein SAE01_02740 [Segetibacter aerophilus]
MKHLRLLVLVLPFLLQAYSSKNIATKTKNAKKWVTLFNGKNLNNWKPKIVGFPLGENFGNTFRVEDGILSIRYDKYDSFRNRFGALYYIKKFANFRLKVEYRFVGNTTPGAPSWGFKDGGIQYHCQSPSTIGLTQSFPVCLEFNCHGGNGKEERPTGEACISGMTILVNGKKNASNCTLPDIKKTFHGEEWVTAEIDVNNGKIRHFVNGEKVIQYENPRLDSTNALAKKLIIAGNDVVKDGYISLQSNSHPMDFRKVEIMEY